MKWRGRRTSSNISDQRGGGGGVRRAGGVGIVGIIVVVIGMFLGVDLTPLIGGGGGVGLTPGQASFQQGGPNTVDDEVEEFVAVVLADTEDVWRAEFERHGATYRPPTLVLFSGMVHSACGQASSAVGPFYCPGDDRIYLDTDFFATLERQLGAKGDFARAYVIAHEVGHHVQNVIGIMAKTDEMKRGMSQVERNEVSVRLELQADCFSGLWARRVQEMHGVLERGDIEEALNAASRIGDDVLQASAGQAVVPDSFTHGTAEQRQRWFWRGVEEGTLEACDTFAVRQL